MQSYHWQPGETVRVSVELPSAVVAALNMLRLADCSAYDTEPVPLSLYLSWWICYEAQVCVNMGGKDNHHAYEDLLGREHSLPTSIYRAMPHTENFSPEHCGPGDFVGGVPWWLTSPPRRPAAGVALVSEEP